MPQSNQKSPAVYRVDRFRVPEAACAAFLERVRAIHEFLRTLPGFNRDRLLEQRGGPGTFNFVTWVEWDDARAMESAREAVASRYREAGFDPQAFLAGLGIDADLASYTEIAGSEGPRPGAFDYLVGCG